MVVVVVSLKMANEQFKGFKNVVDRLGHAPYHLNVLFKESIQKPTLLSE